MSDAAYSLMLLNALAGLATRLSVDGLAIYTVNYDYLAFGSWEIVAGRRQSRVWVSWDGKKALLVARAARLARAGDQPEWQPIRELDFSKKRQDYAAIFAAAYAAIREHAGA
jgi:hypothetical protein